MDRVVTTTLSIAKSPQEVFDFIADTDNWLKIGVLDVQPRGRLALGTEGWHLRKQGRGKARSTWRVTEFEPGRKLTMLAHGGGMEIRDETRLEASPRGLVPRHRDREIAPRNLPAVISGKAAPRVSCSRTAHNASQARWCLAYSA